MRTFRTKARDLPYEPAAQGTELRPRTGTPVRANQLGAPVGSPVQHNDFALFLTPVTINDVLPALAASQVTHFTDSRSLSQTNNYNNGPVYTGTVGTVNYVTNNYNGGEKFGEIQRKLDDLKLGISSVDTSVQSVDTKVGELRKDLAEVKNEVLCVKGEVQSLNNKVDHMNNKVQLIVSTMRHNSNVNERKELINTLTVLRGLIDLLNKAKGTSKMSMESTKMLYNAHKKKGKSNLGIADLLVGDDDDSSDDDNISLIFNLIMRHEKEITEWERLEAKTIVELERVEESMEKARKKENQPTNALEID